MNARPGVGIVLESKDLQVAGQPNGRDVTRGRADRRANRPKPSKRSESRSKLTKRQLLAIAAQQLVKHVPAPLQGSLEVKQNSVPELVLASPAVPEAP